MIWVICVLSFLIAILIIVIVSQKAEIGTWKNLASNRLCLLRHIIELMFLHKGQPLVFLRKAHDEIRFRKLKDAGIIPAIDYSQLSETEKADLFLCKLIEAGFSRKEVCEIFELKSVDSLYVKLHRAKKRLHKMGITCKTNIE